MAGELRISMLIEANAARAKAEVQGMREETAALARAGMEAGAGMSSASDGAAEWGSMVQMLRASLQPMVGEANALAAAADQLAVAEEMGAISAQEAAVAHDMLARQAMELQGRMDALGVTLDGSTASIARHETAVQQLIARNTGLSRSEGESIADHLGHGQALDQLRARFDPLFAKQRQYEVLLLEIAEAERQGAISARIAQEARERAAQAMLPASAGLDRMGRSSQAAAQYAAQLSYQLNDIGMMMALGQSPFMLMMQQGPQVVQVFGQMRLAGVGLGAAFASALGMIVNPMSLITMAVIGFGAAAVQGFGEAEEKVQKLKDAISELTGRVSSYRSALSDTLTPMAELRREWGGQAEQARELYVALADLERLRAMRELRESTAAARSEFSGLAQDIREFRQLEAFVDDARDAVEKGLLSEGALKQHEANLQRYRDRLMETFGLLPAEAERVVAALNALSTASGPEEIAAAARDARAVFMDIAHVAGDRLPAGFLAAGESIIQAEKVALSLAGPLKDSDSYARSLASVDMASGIAAAGREALFLAQQMGITLAAAQGILGLSSKPKSRLGFGLPGAADPIIGGHSGLSFGDNPGNGTRDPGFNPHVPTVDKPKKDGGGGGGGKTEIEKQRDALKTLREEQERQIALLRTTDPAQRIILENHEALAGATKKEKDEVVALILERERLEEVSNRIEEIGQIGERAFTGLATGAHSFSDALSMVLESLAQMAASSVWKMFWNGTGNGDSGLSGIVAGLMGLPAKADGGRIVGPGGPRDDRVLTWTSNGEYVVNAAATAEHLSLLEAINGGASLSDLLGSIAGARPIALADGGYIGDLTGSRAPSAWTSANVGRGSAEGGAGQRQGPLVQIVNHSPEPIRQARGDGPNVDGTVKLIVGRQLASGQYDKQLGARHGLSPEIARR